MYQLERKALHTTLCEALSARAALAHARAPLPPHNLHTHQSDQYTTQYCTNQDEKHLGTEHLQTLNMSHSRLLASTDFLIF